VCGCVKKKKKKKKKGKGGGGRRREIEGSVYDKKKKKEQLTLDDVQMGAEAVELKLIWFHMSEPRS